MNAVVRNIDLLCLKSLLLILYVTYFLIVTQWKVMGHHNICVDPIHHQQISKN